jgi:PAS domain-containing protein
MKSLRRGLLWLVTCAIPVTIAACYGMVMEFYKPGRVLNKETQEGIKDIEVRCADDDGADVDAGAAEDGGAMSDALAVTDEQGGFVLYNDACQNLRFVDVDGDENGGSFETAEAPIGADGEELVVEMTPVS